jgi:hypothetical protein
MLWLYAVIINTLYSFAWDVFMDWGLGFPRDRMGRPQYLFLRPHLDFKFPLIYYVVIVMDLLLRGCWSLKMCVVVMDIFSHTALLPQLRM